MTLVTLTAKQHFEKKERCEHHQPGIPVVSSLSPLGRRRSDKFVNANGSMLTLIRLLIRGYPAAFRLFLLG
ncbi:hypothetical protein BG74_07755 [Sodalis-like endosymbiont of Proechinophthirus fluctus]|uniref:hypothetical protein n=1 Tax=Sodalis-like endosymbiont of Proechinophthirus fluctus TaxID=1462730 RepID=UPI0007A894BB|nr:hypothetical protein [Sodalis-like endosymbiont of Proechinophthirus fluctus]KYP96271.1 hypothetical protein BG74_07755 [Sodalis-like endosymbiont of Proechinophthirus fluctus]